MMLSMNLSTLCLCKAVCIRFAPIFGNVEYVKVRQEGQEFIA